MEISSGPTDFELAQDFLRESIMWQSLKHDHVLPFFGVDKSIFQQTLLPWMPNGNIREVISLWKDKQKSGNLGVHHLSLAAQRHTWVCRDHFSLFHDSYRSSYLATRDHSRSGVPSRRTYRP